MAKFTTYGNKAVATGAGLGPLGITAGTSNPRRAQLLSFGVTCSDAPAGIIVQVRIQRQTVAGTGSALPGTGGLVSAVDSADGATFNAIGLQTYTVTPTITATTYLFLQSFNTSYGMVYYPAPGSEIWYPATASNGIVWDTPIAATTGSNITCNPYFNES